MLRPPKNLFSYCESLHELIFWRSFAGDRCENYDQKTWRKILQKERNNKGMNLKYFTV